MVMASDGDCDCDRAASSQECRLRRRRRFSPHRHVPSAAATSASDEGGNVVTGSSAGEKRIRPASSSSPSDGSSDREEDFSSAGAASHLPLPAPAAPAAWPVAFGSVSLAGRMRNMEDTVSLRPSFCVWADGSPMHFFAVFDGHGGPHVSALCREQMHAILAEELAAEAAGEVEEGRAWRAALSRSFSRVDALAAVACACGRATVPRCECPLSGQTGSIIGSTAVVALLVRDRLVIANCGDSRAVLCRAGSPIPLSSDHKPDRLDEKARIEAAGGQVMYANGARVRGILAMSRALGDKYLKPEVICEPDITITERTMEDECVILASDGMWDVISNETASDVARQCLEDGSPSAGSRAAAGGDEAASSSTDAAAAAAGQEPEPRCYRAAALLARLALGRESSDNISVVVIDLKRRE
ncbi:hypothetical protein GUJ93_ZPchr0023g33382 [Zizania palustris]|uniref:protein-serine/threonine phosphatase n=1 Tax=Zizania palustris TaxID=103762 RepID=A0A8J5UYC3_ZIZPA|nr:hypothetical protein GUJ93_ZPchr0023g33382 [Zizania palustris]